MKTATNTIADHLKVAEDRYLAANIRFMQEAACDPSTAIVLGGPVVERKSHFESLKNAEKYVTGGDYPTHDDAVRAAIDYFATVVRREVARQRQSCDLSRGVRSAELKGICETIEVLESLL